MLGPVTRFALQQWRRSLINYLNVSLFVQSSKEVAVAAPGRRSPTKKKSNKILKKWIKGKKKKLLSRRLIVECCWTGNDPNHHLAVRSSTFPPSSILSTFTPKNGRSTDMSFWAKKKNPIAQRCCCHFWEIFFPTQSGHTEETRDAHPFFFLRRRKARVGGASWYSVACNPRLEDIYSFSNLVEKRS